MRALIVETGQARAALAGVRGLAAAGWEVGVAVPERSLSTASRWCRRWHRVPPLWDGLDGYVEAIEGATERYGYEVILPAGDAEMLTLSVARDRLSAVVPLPAHPSLMTAVDKLELTRAAARAGLAVPRTWEARDGASSAGEGRLIVKPRLHSEPGGPVLRRPAALVRDAASAGAAIARIEQTGGAAVLQEKLNGHLIAWIGLMDVDGSLVTAVQQEARRTHPPDAGVTARGVTVPVSPALTGDAVRLLSALSWTGLAQLQFIVPADGSARLVDLNARCYGSMALALGAGVNFPALWAAVATGRPVARPEPTVGARYQWLEGDLRSAWLERRGGLRRDLGDVLRWSLNAHHSVWSAADPLPALMQSREIAGRAIARATGDRAAAKGGS
jgi:predicted ATP-grasp superfamily ATP-dependent carboligase